MEDSQCDAMNRMFGDWKNEDPWGNVNGNSQPHGRGLWPAAACGIQWKYRLSPELGYLFVRYRKVNAKHLPGTYSLYMVKRNLTRVCPSQCSARNVANLLACWAGQDFSWLYGDIPPLTLLKFSLMLWVLHTTINDLPHKVNKPGKHWTPFPVVKPPLIWRDHKF